MTGRRFFNGKFHIGKRIFLFFLLGLVHSGCQKEIDGLLKPKDFLKPPSIINPAMQYGHLKTDTIVVPATADIFLAGADDDAFIDYPDGGLKDTAVDNSPIPTLEGVLLGGETLDIYATGKARHLPLVSISYGPRGWVQSGIIVKSEEVLDVYPFEGLIGSLVGLFDNQGTPFVIGKEKHVTVPRGARILYLAMLDYPGASSDNAGSYTVTIDVIRR